MNAFGTAVAFFVPGSPVPQPRPKVSTQGGFARAYVPAKHPVHEYRRQVKFAAKAAGLTETGWPIDVRIVATFVRPKSHWNKRGLKPDAPILPRPDVDNIAKAVLDSLQDVIGDDSLVAVLRVWKQYGEDEGTTIEVRKAMNSDL